MNLNKLGQGYKRPKKTYTDKLTDDDIEDMLEDYIEVENINQVPLGSHLRYFTIIKGEKKFRTGGFLHRNDGLPAYVMIRNNQNVWSVQTKSAIFFRKMNEKEIKAEYEDTIQELENKIKALKTLAKKLKDENTKLKKLMRKS